MMKPKIFLLLDRGGLGYFYNIVMANSSFDIVLTHSGRMNESYDSSKMLVVMHTDMDKKVFGSNPELEPFIHKFVEEKKFGKFREIVELDEENTNLILGMLVL